MSKRITVMLSLVLLGTSSAWAGENPSAKLAMHVVASGEYLYCPDLTPAACESINVDISVEEILAANGYGHVAFVAYDVDGITGAEYAVDGWPTGRGAPQLSGPFWCPEGTLTMGNHLGSGGISSFPCAEASANGIVLVGYVSFGPVNEEDLPIALEYVGSSFSYPNDPHNLVLDCTVDYEEDAVVSATGCTIGGTQEGQPECPGELGRGDDGSVRIGELIQVTDGSTRYMQPVWSPDGSKIAFTREAFEGIYVRNADGSGPIRTVTRAQYSGYEPVWTADSRALIQRTRTGPVEQQITRVDVETGEVLVLARGKAKVGALQRNVYGDFGLEVGGEWKLLDTVTGSLKSVDEYYAGRPQAPNDYRLEIDFQRHRMWIVSGDGSFKSEFPHSVYTVRLSPAGDKVVFTKRDGSLCVSDVDGSHLVNLGKGALAEWASNGRQVVFVGAIRQGDFDVIAAEIFVANADGSEVTQLTRTPEEVEEYPKWSPDGTRIAYNTVNTGKIYVAVLEKVR